MKNNLIMISDLMNALTDMLSQYGDLPVLISDKDSIQCLSPLIDCHVIELSAPDIDPEKALLLTNFILCSDDNTDVGYWSSNK